MLAFVCRKDHNSTFDTTQGPTQTTLLIMLCAQTGMNNPVAVENARRLLDILAGHVPGRAACHDSKFSNTVQRGESDELTFRRTRLSVSCLRLLARLKTRANTAPLSRCCQARLFEALGR